jgi:hypothetical protein
MVGGARPLLLTLDSTAARAKRRMSQILQHFEKERKESTMFNTGYNGLLGVLILIGDIWAIINIFQSSASNEKKLLWTLVVVFLPLLGLILWFFLGPRGGRT